MSDEDVLRLVGVLETADGGCSTCFRRLCRRAGQVWPEIQVRLQAAYAVAEEGSEIPLDFTADD